MPSPWPPGVLCTCLVFPSIGEAILPGEGKRAKTEGRLCRNLSHSRLTGQLFAVQRRGEGIRRGEVATQGRFGVRTVGAFVNGTVRGRSAASGDIRRRS